MKAKKCSYLEQMNILSAQWRYNGYLGASFWENIMYALIGYNIFLSHKCGFMCKTHM